MSYADRFVFLSIVYTVICLFPFFTDYNHGEWGSSKDIPGFPEYPPFSFSAKNRKLWVSLSCGFSIKRNHRLSSFVLLSLEFPFTVWDTFSRSRSHSVPFINIHCFFFHSRSFETESEESRSVFLLFFFQFYFMFFFVNN